MSGTLSGTRILLTRDARSAAAWIDALQAEGAIVEARPVLEFTPAGQPSEVCDAVTGLHAGDWIVLASGNGARFFADACRTAGCTRPDGVRVAAIGAATARSAAAAGWPTDLVATRAQGGEFGEELVARVGSAATAMLVRPEVGRPELGTALRDAGVNVVERVVYRAVPAEGLPLLSADVAAARFSAIVFTSPSIFRELLGGEASPEGFQTALKATRRVAIGPTTADEMTRSGWPPHAVAVRPDTEGIVDAVRDALEREDRRGPC